MKITYAPHGHFIAVFLDGQPVGGIYQVADGFQYMSKSNQRGAVFATIAKAKADLESGNISYE